MSDKPSQALAKGEKADVAESEQDDAPKSKLSWIVGWVLVPGTVIGVIFGGGAMVGAHFHESWFTRMIVWTVELFV